MPLITLLILMKVTDYEGVSSIRQPFNLAKYKNLEFCHDSRWISLGKMGLSEYFSEGQHFTYILWHFTTGLKHLFHVISCLCNTFRPRESREWRRQLGMLDEGELFMELIRDVSNELDIDVLCHKILVNVVLFTSVDRGTLFLARWHLMVAKLLDVTVPTGYKLLTTIIILTFDYLPLPHSQYQPL